MKRVIVFTCKGVTKPIEINHLECNHVNESLAKKNAVPFKEIGPKLSLRLRRDKMATVELYKEACRKTKILNPERKRANKNKFTNEIGETKGKVYI